jgi:carbamoyl-phosphate synthase large subunit
MYMAVEVESARGVESVRVLYTGGGGAGTEALWNLLKHRHDQHFADADVGRVNPIVPADKAHQVPFASDPNFKGVMKALCEDLQIDVLVPGVDEELEQLSLTREQFAPTVILMPTFAFTRTMLDKFEFARALAALGVQVPRTQLLADSRLWSAYPCIVKPRRGRGSRGVTVVATGIELEAIRTAVSARSDEYVVQELAAGTEYSVQVVADSDQRLRAVFPARIIAKRGITISAIGEQNQAVIEACERIHQSVPTSGCYNVQGILGEDLSFLPFEINPRVSTTLCLAVASGIDPVEIFTTPAERQGLVPFESGVALNRFWHNAFTRPSAD